MTMSEAELRAQLALPLSDDGARVLEVLTSIIQPLAASLPANTEVVLHELGRLPNSVIAIAGNVTGRRIGDPATDLLLEQLRNVDRERDRIGYHNVLPDGRQLRSTTMIVSDKAGTPVAALCINSDVSPWLAARSLIDGMVAVALGVSRFTIYNYLNELDSTGKRDE